MVQKGNKANQGSYLKTLKATYYPKDIEICYDGGNVILQKEEEEIQEQFMYDNFINS